MWLIYPKCEHKKKRKTRLFYNQSFAIAVWTAPNLCLRKLWTALSHSAGYTTQASNFRTDWYSVGDVVNFTPDIFASRDISWHVRLDRPSSPKLKINILGNSNTWPQDWQVGRRTSIPLTLRVWDHPVAFTFQFLSNGRQFRVVDLGHRSSKGLYTHPRHIGHMLLATIFL